MYKQTANCVKTYMLTDFSKYRHTPFYQLKQPSRAQRKIVQRLVNMLLFLMKQKLYISFKFFCLGGNCLTQVKHLLLEFFEQYFF